MKSSEILREAARRIEGGATGCYAVVAQIADGPITPGYLDIFFNFYDCPVPPKLLPADVRSTALCLAAAIAESEGD